MDKDGNTPEVQETVERALTDREITLDHLRDVERDLLQHLEAVQHTILLLTV